MKLMIVLIGGVVVLLSSLTDFLNKLHFPKDAENTLEKVSNHTIRVGFTHAEPWVYPSGTGAQGIEANIVTAFAQTLHANIDWIEGTEEQLFTALRRNEIDMLIGGITDKSPWKNEAGLTKPYIETSLVIGRPTSMPVSNSTSIEMQWVAVKKGTEEGYYVRQKKAKPFYTLQLPANNMLTVGYDFQLSQWHLANTGIVLEKENHVMAVPPGENAFLSALEKYLFTNKDAIQKQLNQ